MIKWEVSDFNYNVKDFDQVCDLNPSLLIIGTGNCHCQLKQNIMDLFLSKKIFVEVMNTKSACGTYKLLVQEYQNLVGAFLA